MNRVHVLGTAMTRFGPAKGLTAHDLARDAVYEAVRASRLAPDRIEAAYAASVGQRPGFGQKVLAKAGLEGLPVVNVENACASGSTAVHCLFELVRHGVVRAGIAFGADHLTSPQGGLLPVATDDLEGALGRSMPAAFAMSARLHMQRYGTTAEQMAAVAVKNRRHGSLNPLCHMQGEVTIADVLSAPMIADPLTRLSCCPISDGAAAVVLGDEQTARECGAPGVEISASVLVSGRRTRFGIVGEASPMTVEAAARAYATAGVSAADIDVCELHDPFTIAELIHYEDLGFCGPGEGGRFVVEGRSGLNGEVAVSTSGGLLAKGHPLGATGLAQVHEIVTQLLGRGGARQVKGARTGMTHLVGGAVTGLESAACTVQIFRS